MAPSQRQAVVFQHQIRPYVENVWDKKRVVPLERLELHPIHLEVTAIMKNPTTHSTCIIAYRAATAGYMVVCSIHATGFVPAVHGAYLVTPTER